MTEEVGCCVFEADSEKADYLLNNMQTIEMLPDNEKEEGTLYIMADGAAVNIDKINYPEYRAKGYFVGSGAIESANKVIEYSCHTWPVNPETSDHKIQ